MSSVYVALLLLLGIVMLFLAIRGYGPDMINVLISPTHTPSK